MRIFVIKASDRLFTLLERWVAKEVTALKESLTEHQLPEQSKYTALKNRYVSAVFSVQIAVEQTACYKRHGSTDRGHYAEYVQRSDVYLKQWKTSFIKKGKKNYIGTINR